MAIKSIEAVSGCFAKAADDEPLFVLRAQDIFAPLMIRTWADEVEISGGSASKVAEARALADKMEVWPNRKIPD